MKNSIFSLFIFAVTFSLYSQTTEKVFLNKNDTHSNSYIVFSPLTIPLKGYMFLIPGFGESAEWVLLQTELPKLAAESGILTVIPTFVTGPFSFGIDSISQQSFRDILEDVHRKYKMQDQPFFVGGFSIGGSCAVKYAELAVQKNEKIKPSAVFAIDPPLDFERFYNSSIRDLRLAKKGEQNKENRYMIQRIQQEFGGTPETVQSNFHTLSPYSFLDTNQTAIKYLINTPIQIYSEPDVNWWMNECGEDFSSMNVLDCSSMINELKKLGNDKAELIVTINKGYRNPDKNKHPHAWSIVDNEKLIHWLLEQK